MNFAFVGGTYRGYQLLKEFLLKEIKPSIAFILKEDEHEHEKYSEELVVLAEKNGIPAIVKRKLNATDYEKLSKMNLDFMVICGWRTIINPAVDHFLKYGMFAAHDSLLPKYRGFAPSNWAMINGEKLTGVTLFRITDGEVDSGKVYGQKEVEILDTDFAWDLYLKITQATVDLFIKFIEDVRNETLHGYIQDESKATYTCKRTPGDGKIDWAKSSVQVYNLIRALTYPFPGSFCEYEANVFIIRKAVLGKRNQNKFVGIIPGRVISCDETGIEVMCAEGTILIQEWELKGAGIIENPFLRIKSITATLS